MADRTYYCLCVDSCLFETMTKEQILAAIKQAVETGTITDVDTGFVTRIQETNKNKQLQFWVGDNAEYNALTEKDENTFYIITNDTTFTDVASRINDVACELASTKAAIDQTHEVLDAKIAVEEMERTTAVDAINTTLANGLWQYIGAIPEYNLEAQLGDSILLPINPNWKKYRKYKVVFDMFLAESLSTSVDDCIFRIQPYNEASGVIESASVNVVSFDPLSATPVTRTTGDYIAEVYCGMVYTDDNSVGTTVEIDLTLGDSVVAFDVDMVNSTSYNKMKSYTGYFSPYRMANNLCITQWGSLNFAHFCVKNAKVYGMTR